MTIEDLKKSAVEISKNPMVPRQATTLMVGLLMIIVDLEARIKELEKK